MENSHLSVGQIIDVISITRDNPEYNMLYKLGETGIVLKYSNKGFVIAIIGSSSSDESFRNSGWLIYPSDFKVVARLRIKTLKVAA